MIRRLQNVFAIINPEADTGDFKVIIGYYFKIGPQLFHKEVLAKPPEWEGQRPRCPIRLHTGRGSVLAAHYSPPYGQRGRCPSLVLQESL